MFVSPSVSLKQAVGVIARTSAMLKCGEFSVKCRTGKVWPLHRLAACEGALLQKYAGALLAATPPDQLVDSGQPKRFRNLPAAEVSRMEREMSLVQSRFKLIEQSYGNDMLNMVLSRGYLNKLLTNKAVASYLQRRQPDLLEEFRSIVKITSLEDEGEVPKVA